MTFGPSRIPAFVLVVEDEMVLRRRAVGMVEDAGYTPLEALDTDEALAILSSRSDTALVCADIQLPGSMDGIGLAHTVRRRWPAIDVILMSEKLTRRASIFHLAASSMVSRSRLGRSKLVFVG